MDEPRALPPADATDADGLTWLASELAEQQAYGAVLSVAQVAEILPPAAPGEIEMVQDPDGVWRETA
ncbi:hypothetical protein [Methylobacterium planeticum]|uniref:Uncharacterized protein n=1 Tax=Methylobacterium planeticum TaxID=2615211 RepID=A0A6N6MJZ4_9HYPH|nr:hypothetical protein [Methylobacterium planeticum]KAB1068488.1 hypothetical protein F6X51_26890 [Methylobacterium planeticum]